MMDGTGNLHHALTPCGSRPFHLLEISSWFGRIQPENQNPFSEQKVEKSEDDRAPVPDQSVRPDSQL
jgi:hypothetical protein